VSSADGLITVNQPVETLRRVIDAFHEGGGADRPVYVQVHLSWAEDDETALAIAHDQWRTNTFDSTLAWNLELPAQFDAAAMFVRPEDVCGSVLVSSDMSRHVGWLTEFAELGVDGLYLHQVGREQEHFIETFAASVLPEVTA
jgi:hypothetical protein